MKEQLQAIVTVLSLVNPAICGAMFARIEAHRSRREQLADATKAALATAVILTLSAAHTGLDLPVTALVAIAVAGVLTWLVLLLVSRVAGKASQGSLARDMITRFMGLIVLSMGVQFALTGLQKFGTL